MWLLILGLLAGLLQFVGYFTYIRHQGRDEIEPNPHTWLMFAYGTAVLTVLELDAILSHPEHDLVTTALLILPIVCSFGAIWVFFVIWKKHRDPQKTRNVWWPEDRTDQISLLVDIITTVAYVGIWLLLAWQIITGEIRVFYALVLLFLSNLSTFPGFVPMLREVWKTPETEDWRPWSIWSLAYLILTVATYLEVGTFWHALMFYPLSNALMHALVGVFAARAKKSNV